MPSSRKLPPDSSVKSTRVKNRTKLPAYSKVPAARAAARKDGPKPAKRNKGLPWEEILAAYLTPTVTEDGSTPRWPTLKDVAEKYECSYDNLRAHSAAEGWVGQQHAVIDAWWSERTKTLNHEMARKAGAVVAQAFMVGAKAINASAATFNGNPDSAASLRAITAAQRGFDLIIDSLGVKSAREALTLLGLQSATFIPGEVVKGDRKDDAEPPAPVPTSLWSMVMNARATIGAADPAVIAQFEEPSSLPGNITGAVNVG